MTAVDEDLIHTWQKGTVSRRYNRFLNKCRGNFFPPEPKEAPRSGQARFPRPAARPVEAAMERLINQFAHQLIALRTSE